MNSMSYYMVQHHEVLNPDSIGQFFSDKICELGDVHEVFIALFTLRGRYIISSRMDMMDSLRIPEQINYSILKQLSTGNERAVIDRDFQHEKYALAYWYFYDTKGKPIGITNVVYEKTPEKRDELEGFLKELSKSYIILFLLAALLAYFLSSYITRSLQTITRKMREVHLGARNSPITWSSSDEIGQLVHEFNTMVDKLDDSAKKLAQTERESAWREMAQQVAHEIKNPLTPMKLRTQQLMRTWEDHSDDFEIKLKRYGTGMIEQIDALANIAGEFSSFAKMPKPELKLVDLVQLIEGVVELYQLDTHHQIRLRIYGVKQSVLPLDKDQIIRVMNNLITNALQAIPTDKQGRIDIAVRGSKHQIIVRVQDNGVGIHPDIRHKIFVPNFTTKSTGSGLGLTMVKNIMLQNNGMVRCFSHEGKGASFYLFFYYA